MRIYILLCSNSLILKCRIHKRCTSKNVNDVWCICPTNYRKQKLRKVNQTIKNLVKRKHRDFPLKIQDSFRDNPKLCWSYHKVTFHHRSTHTPAISYKSKHLQLNFSTFTYLLCLSFKIQTTTRFHLLFIPNTN